MTQAPAKSQPRVRGSGDKPVKDATPAPVARMKLTIDQPAFARALGIVGRAVSTRPMIPVLSNVKLEAAGGELKLTATSIVLTIQTSVPCRVEQEGTITLPAGALTSLVASFDKRNEVRLEMDEAKPTTAVVRSGKSVSRMNGLPPDDFPQVPLMADPQIIELPAKAFCRTLGGMLYATASQGHADERPYLHGVTMTFDADALTLFAADGFRMVFARLDGDTHLEGVTEMSIPAQSLREVERLFATSEGSVRLLVGKGDDARRVQFEGEGVLVASQVLDGSYWRGLKGTQESGNKKRAAMGQALQVFKTDITVNAEALKQVLRRARIFAQDNGNYCRLKISVENGVEVTGRSQQSGEAYDVVEATIGGEDLIIGHNLLYLLDAIENLGEIETVRLRCNSSTQPMTIMDAAHDDQFAALSPMEEQA